MTIAIAVGVWIAVVLVVTRWGPGWVKKKRATCVLADELWGYGVIRPCKWRKVRDLSTKPDNLWVREKVNSHLVGRAQGFDIAREEQEKLRGELAMAAKNARREGQKFTFDELCSNYRLLADADARVEEMKGIFWRLHNAAKTCGMEVLPDYRAYLLLKVD